MQKKEREQFVCPKCGNDHFIIAMHEEVTTDYHCTVATDGSYVTQFSGNTYGGHSMDVDDEIECDECSKKYSLKEIEAKHNA